MMQELLLVGAGPMAVDYARVLDDIGVEFGVIGRGRESGRDFEAETGRAVVPGGVEAALTKGSVPERAVVAVGVDQLTSVARRLLSLGVNDLLVEKPGGIDALELAALADDARSANARVLIAYNRRNYASVRRAAEILEEDGGALSFSFEFTEWVSQVPEQAPRRVKEHWLLANSSHVVDLAFFLGGWPVQLDCEVAGGLEWHPSGSVFSGSGRTEGGALFSYTANWEAPGRWGVELMTRHRRLVLRPLEQLSVQRHGALTPEPEAIDDNLDRRFKPGLHRQVSAFLHGGTVTMPTIDEQLRAAREVYARIAGYDDLAR